MEHKIQSDIVRDERISRYLKGKMNAQEEMKFLSDMESDDQLKQDAIAQARLVKGMAQVDHELIQELKNASDSKIAVSIGKKELRFRKPITWISIAASIVVILFAGYKGYDYYDTTRLGMEYANVFPMETIVRGNTDSTIESELQSLFDNVVDRKELTTTTTRLHELWDISNQDTYNDYTDYAPYIGWYLAIGYLEDYEKEKAKVVLKTMESQSQENVNTQSIITTLLKHL